MPISAFATACYGPLVAVKSKRFQRAGRQISRSSGQLREGFDMSSTMAVLAERTIPEGSAPATSSLERDAASPTKATLSDAELLAEIGRSLTAVYVDFLQQPIPRRTANVLNQIKVAFRA